MPKYYIEYYVTDKLTNKAWKLHLSMEKYEVFAVFTSLFSKVKSLPMDVERRVIKIIDDFAKFLKYYSIVRIFSSHTKFIPKEIFVISLIPCEKILRWILPEYFGLTTKMFYRTLCIIHNYAATLHTPEYLCANLPLEEEKKKEFTNFLKQLCRAVKGCDYKKFLGKEINRFRNFEELTMAMGLAAMFFATTACFFDLTYLIHGRMGVLAKIGEEYISIAKLLCEDISVDEYIETIVLFGKSIVSMSKNRGIDEILETIKNLKELLASTKKSKRRKLLLSLLAIL
ncbi:hypothetical protein DRP04_03920 [Archaeoglobales archaeon]|nr:MAG: hypothetical protein DRP04_03920 [Archaeoglobales archaeon]